MRRGDMTGRFGSRRAAVCGALLLATTGLTGIAASPALAQAASAGQRSFNIPAQPLREALLIFSQQSGLQVTAQGPLVEGRMGAAVSGSYAPADALARLLAGTGLTYRFDGNDAVRLERAPQAGEGAVQLGTLRVEGASAGEGTGTGTRGIISDWAGEADRPWQAPSSQVHLSQEHIQRFRGTNVGDIISGIPGVHTGENRNSGGLDLNIRGMQGMNRVPVVIDGAHQSTVVYRGYSGSASRNYLDPDLLGEMVIEKGPSTRPEAVGATGGIMVARTIAVEDILKPGESFGVRLRGELRGNTISPPPPGTKAGLQTGQFNPMLHGQTSSGWLRSCTHTDPNSTACDGRPFVFEGPIPDAVFYQEDPPGKRPHMLEPTDGGGSIVIGKRWDNFDIIGAYARRKSGNYFAGTHGPTAHIVSVLTESLNGNDRTGYRTRIWENIAPAGDTRFRSGEQVVNSGYDNTSYLVKATGRFGDGHALELGFNRFDSDYGDMMPSEIVRGEGFQQGEASNVVVDSYTARYRFQPENNSWINLRANLWHKYIEVERNLYYGLLRSMTSWLPGEPIFVPAALEYSKRTGVDIDNTSSLSGAWGDLTLRYGASYTWEDLRSDDYPDLPTGSYSLDVTIMRPDGKRDEWSTFLSAEYNPREWLQLDAAIRYTGSDGLDRKPRTQYRDESGRWVDYDEPQFLRMKRDGFAPIFALTVKPYDGLQFYARYAEAIRTPSLFESAVGFGSAGTRDAIESLLQPERMRSREVGMNYDGALLGRDRFRLHAAYFNNKVKDYITRSGAVGGSADANIENAIFEGLEVRAEYDRGWIYGAIGGMYYLDLNYCHYTPENPPNNFQKCHPDGIGFSDTQIPPKESYSGTIGTRWFAERLDVGMRVTYNGRRPDMTFVGSGSVNVRWTPHTIFDLYSSFEVNDVLSVDINIDNVGDRYYADPLLIGLTPAPGRTMRLGMTARF